MGILDRIRKPKADTTEETKAKKAPAKKKAAAKPAAEAQASEAKVHANTKGNEFSSRHLLRPHVSEKAARLATTGSYVFEVPSSAEKISIKKAVEGLYGVKVVSIRTINTAGKAVTRGRRVSFRADWKKAIVTLKPGQKIDLYEGV